jgi:hypothetical protein
MAQEQHDGIDRSGRVVLAKFFERADRSLQWESSAIAVAGIARFAIFIWIRAGGEELRQAVDVARLKGVEKGVRHGFPPVSLRILGCSHVIHRVFRQTRPRDRRWTSEMVVPGQDIHGKWDREAVSRAR